MKWLYAFLWIILVIRYAILPFPTSATKPTPKKLSPMFLLSYGIIDKR